MLHYSFSIHKCGCFSLEFFSSSVFGDPQVFSNKKKTVSQTSVFKLTVSYFSAIVQITVNLFINSIFFPNPKYNIIVYQPYRFYPCTSSIFFPNWKNNIINV